MPKRRKIVAAGWYVGVGVTFLLTSVPAMNLWFRGTLFVVGMMCLCGAAYEWWFRKTDEPSPERLDAGQVRAIIQTVHAGLVRWKDVLRAGGCPDEDLKKPFEIQLIAMGDELRTLEYRADFFRAFEGGGLKVAVDECPPGALEFEHFIGTVTVVEAEHPNNAIRAIVVDALRSAGIEIREVPYLPLYSPRRNRHIHFSATVVVGQPR